MKCKNQSALACPIGNIGARACPMATYSGFYESHKPPPSGDVCGIVPPHCDGHRSSQQRGYILHRCFVNCRHGGRRSNMEQVGVQWQCPVASDVALDMLHWAVPHVLFQRLHITIKMACDGGTFARHRRYFA
jgi:hypothetical protein